jgi:hypothetical protein
MPELSNAHYGSALPKVSLPAKVPHEKPAAAGAGRVKVMMLLLEKRLHPAMTKAWAQKETRFGLHRAGVSCRRYHMTLGCEPV